MLFILTLRKKIVLCLMTVVCSSPGFILVSGAQLRPVLITFQPYSAEVQKKVQYFNSVLIGLLGIHTPTHTFTVFDFWVLLFVLRPIVWFYTRPPGTCNH